MHGNYPMYQAPSLEDYDTAKRDDIEVFLADSVRKAITVAKAENDAVRRVGT